MGRFVQNHSSWGPHQPWAFRSLYFPGLCLSLLDSYTRSLSAQFSGGSLPQSLYWVQLFLHWAQAKWCWELFFSWVNMFIMETNSPKCFEQGWYLCVSLPIAYSKMEKRVIILGHFTSIMWSVFLFLLWGFLNHSLKGSVWGGIYKI